MHPSEYSIIICYMHRVLLDATTSLAVDFNCPFIYYTEECLYSSLFIPILFLSVCSIRSRSVQFHLNYDDALELLLKMGFTLWSHIYVYTYDTILCFILLLPPTQFIHHVLSVCHRTPTLYYLLHISIHTLSLSLRYHINQTLSCATTE